MPIYHLTPLAYYQAQPLDRPYTPPEFEQDGFIHCTATLGLLVEVANRFYAHLEDQLLVLEIDPGRLTAPLKYESPRHPQPTAPGPLDQHRFPHIYGPLNRAAISRTFPLHRRGAWHLPV